MEKSGEGFRGGKTADSGARGRGRGRSNDYGGRGSYDHQQQQSQQRRISSTQESSSHATAGTRGRGRGGVGGRPTQGYGRGRDDVAMEPTIQFNPYSGQDGTGGRGHGRGRGRGSRGAGVEPTTVGYGGGRSNSGRSRGRGGRGDWVSSASGQERIVPEMQSLEISSGDGKGGKDYARTISLRVNHFLLSYDPESIIRHYDVNIKPDAPAKNDLPLNVPKTVLSMVRNKLSSDNPTQFPLSMTVYDGERNIFSRVLLPTGIFKVELSKSEGLRIRSFIIEVQLVNEMKYDRLNNYLSRNTASIPQDILQGLEVVMKENPTRQMVCASGIFHPVMPYPEDDLGRGITASRGIKHTLKPTSQGLALCLDYSVLPLLKQMPVFDFLKEHIRGFNLNNFKAFSGAVESALKGLKVIVTHRTTNQKFRIAGLTDNNTQDISFDVDKISGRKVKLVDYFREKYKKNIMHRNIPCLDLGKNNKKNYVPMEFCNIAEGQRYPKEKLNRYQSEKLRKISLASPKGRENTIYDMIQSNDGPSGGDIIQNFGIGVDMNMTKVTGQVLAPPELKLGTSGGQSMKATVDREKCNWNLNKKSVIHSHPVRLWGVLNFSTSDLERFAFDLISRTEQLNIHMEEPVFNQRRPMNLLHNVDNLYTLLDSLNNECYEARGSHLQLLVCVLPNEDSGYNNLKWVSETKVGIVTQCCLSENAFRPKDQFLANLALKINAKLGGSNVELFKQPRCLQSEGHVMFIGADVNHPGSYNATSPSIAAVVATMNWPAINQYGARICPQGHRIEKILKFGGLCLELVDAYARINQERPEKIVVFRDGVSAGQFNMVLNEELKDLKAAFESINYFPAITLIVAQKRHSTRLFLDSSNDKNVPPGTVVDTVITAPSGSDFYLCSHFGQIGTSKPAHYQVLENQIEYTPEELQELIYNICFTSAQCTKPVSLVPPLVYADRAAYRGRLYYNSQELHQPAGSSSTPSKSTFDSFDEQSFKLQSNLENSMFFI